MHSPAMPKSVLRSLLSGLPKLRNRHYFVIDIVTLCLLPSLALLLRVERPTAMQPYLHALFFYTLFALVVRLFIFRLSGLYSRFWRYATVDELNQTAIAVVSSTLFILMALYLRRSLGLWPDHTLPRSLPILDGLLALAVVGATRFSARMAQNSLRDLPQPNAKRALIVGAGEAGQLMVKELKANPQLGLKPIGFLDDDVQKRNVRIQNLPVFGSREQLAEVVSHQKIDQVLIAMPKAPGKTIRQIVTLCEEAGVPTKTMPGMYEILSGNVNVSQLRNVEIEDLLRREPIQTDIAAVRDLIQGRRVLITGSGGSIGSELCRQVLACNPSDLILVGHGENTVFDIHNELKNLLQKQFPGERAAEAPTLHALIADIRFPKRVRNVVQKYRPEIIFHAAAHKHVPLMEANPSEAITNNVFGTKNLLDAAIAADVEHFVMISTDKAVNPTSVMGASKRVAELLVLRAAPRSGKSYVAVRFGNVLGSRGSVVPTFKRQIAAGGPVTVCHPDMQRYFMTIPEAVQLVLQASVLGHCGEIFMLDMGDPVKIADLARDLIELSGFEVGRDIDIVYTGIRPGEKLFEELLLEGESYHPTPHQKIRLARSASAFVPLILDDTLAMLEQAVGEDNRSAIIRCLQDLIPDFQPDEARKALREAPAYAVVETAEAAEASPVNHNRRHLSGAEALEKRTGLQLLPGQTALPENANLPVQGA